MIPISLRNQGPPRIPILVHAVVETFHLKIILWYETAYVTINLLMQYYILYFILQTTSDPQTLQKANADQSYDNIESNEKGLSLFNYLT